LSSFSFSLLLFPLPPLFSLSPLSLSPLFLFFLPSFDPPLLSLFVFANNGPKPQKLS
jgi:hypothetical protein